jgi:hypothetical protein
VYHASSAGGVAEQGAPIARRRTAPTPPRVEMRMLNGLPALVVELDDGARGEAGRFVIRADVDSEGRIVPLHSILATWKLTAVAATGGDRLSG